ncbi:uncharacterized protein Dwil_GK21420 [Drosophila willistoni]|uniref:GK21420 n=1 Tax=Drosophila willistoni TaxID=7260 RepID=B4MQI5_DROWI|nr:uncharacterized protein LOC6640317 [Drosophila willistoni]EDW74374.1 uncharacterized protein Dwil_GK21420 [Drosophila willistoni]
MEQIWQQVCSHYEVPEQVASEWYTRIQQQLSQDSPTRAYHNWQKMMHHKMEHLAECVKRHRFNIVLAAFFQYYHFDGNRSCVQQNCEIFEEFCHDAQFEDEQGKAIICNLLGRSKNKEHELEMELMSHCVYEEEANMLQDMDLVILAAPLEEYKRYTKLLRLEYTNLDDANYKAMRVKVLETLLMIPSIYATAEYHEKYEDLARSNIRNEIAELKQEQ